jgi:hypothetical protein
MTKKEITRKEITKREMTRKEMTKKMETKNKETTIITINRAINRATDKTIKKEKSDRLYILTLFF